VGVRSFLKNFYQKRILKMRQHEIRIANYRKMGMTIGDNCWIFSDDLGEREAYLITIGDHVMISGAVSFTAHDASLSYYVEGASDLFGRINIGNNCFIGMHAIILPGVTIADNCIVGAGSVVTKSFMEPNSVIAGNPAKKICTVDELREKNKKYCLNTWGMSFEEKKKYLLANEDKFKKA